MRVVPALACVITKEPLDFVDMYQFSELAFESVGINKTVRPSPIRASVTVVVVLEVVKVTD